ncbi:MAG TPA: ankyrin repeat domain-containing protein [Vicinamibacterales bacterium]|jgi:ankyrin repeat protein|nr:ankyrin repeat domain-containing protein [Vicinamibacterales bacterium]
MRAKLMTSVGAALACASLMSLTSPTPAFAADTRLVDAAEKRDSAAVAALLKQGADVNATQADGATALHWAAHWNDLTAAKALLAAHAGVNTANDYGVTPLFLAAGNGSAEMTAALVAAGADAKAKLPSGETVLMTAVRSGSFETVKKLLASGADPNVAQTSKGQTPLMWAATDQRVQISKALIAAGADVRAHSKSGFTPLMFAAREDSQEMCELLLAAGADINENAPDGSTPLLVATVRGHAKLAMYFLDHGAQPDGYAPAAGYTPLHWASSMAETPVTYRGIEAPGEWRAIPGVPDPDLRVALVKSLIAHGANLEARITKPMMTVVAFEARSRTGGTPFFTAAASGDAPMMRLLLAYGADPLARTADGSTALMVAAGALGQTVPNIDRTVVVSEQDRVAAVDLAWQLGTDLEAEDKQGYRAMHIATSAGFREIVKWLLAKGADLNAKSKDRIEEVYGKKVLIPGQTPRGTAEGYYGGALFSRPDMADFVGTLGGISIGKVDLESYIDQVRPGVTAPKDPPPPRK